MILATDEPTPQKCRLVATVTRDHSNSWRGYTPSNARELYSNGEAITDITYVESQIAKQSTRLTMFVALQPIRKHG